MPQTQVQILPLRASRGVFARLVTVLSDVATRRRDRQRLGQLDAHLLRDIGLDLGDARREADKPFWRP